MAMAMRMRFMLAAKTNPGWTSLKLNLKIIARMRFPLLLCLVTASLIARDLPPQIAPALQPFVDDKTIPGAVTLVIGKDGIKSLETVGVRDLAAKDAMPKDAMFWIASMTKPMTAMAVMMLVEEGKLSIDDPVEKHLPEFIRCIRRRRAVAFTGQCSVCWQRSQRSMGIVKTRDVAIKVQD